MNKFKLPWNILIDRGMQPQINSQYGDIEQLQTFNTLKYLLENPNNVSKSEYVILTGRGIAAIMDYLESKEEEKE